MEENASMVASDDPVDEQNTDPAESRGEESPDPKKARGATRPLRVLLDRLGGSRAALMSGLAAVMTLLLGASAAWVLVPPSESEPPGIESEPLSHRAGVSNRSDPLVEQKLEPFYIPLPRGKEGRMARVSFAVTWDRSSSGRFRKQETRVRDRLFHRMTELAAQGENMRSMSLTIRTEARNILEELLQPEELRVVVTGIFIV